MVEKKVITKVGVISLGKIFGLLYAIFGLIAGIFISLFSLAGAPMDDGFGMGFVFGIGAIVVLPILYGIMGFIGGIITAAIYNVAAGIIGGVELEVETGS